MAEISPLPLAGGACEFCNKAPATLVVGGRLACERHKNSEIVKVDFSSHPSSPVSRPSGGDKKSGKDDDDDDVIEAWEPSTATAGSSISSPAPNSLPVWGAISSSSSSNPRYSSPSSSSSSSGSSPGGVSSLNALLVVAPSLGSPAAPLTASPKAASNVDDDVEVVGVSPGPGVVKVMGAPPLLASATSFSATVGVDGGGGSSSRGDDGRSKNPKLLDRSYRRRPRTPAKKPGLDVVDLVTAADFSAADVRPSAPSRKRRNSFPGGDGISDGEREEHQHRRGSGSDEAADEDAPTTAEKGKRKRQKKPVRPEVPCIVCFESKPVERSARCAEGHAMCKACVTSYVTETLMPQGTVFWDRIKCGGSSTCGHLFGPSVTSLLPRPVVRKVEIKQMDVAHLVAGERDPTSDKCILKHSKECPNCGVPIQRSSGCMHMTCVMCQHHFWYKCDCKYPAHATHCRKK